jgi:hypothetical protein
VLFLWIKSGRGFPPFMQTSRSKSSLKFEVGPVPIDRPDEGPCVGAGEASVEVQVPQKVGLKSRLDTNSPRRFGQVIAGLYG